MNLYRLPHPALFTRHAPKPKRREIRETYVRALARFKQSKGSQAVHRARRENVRRQEAA